jgi:hypothetical protein
MQKEYRFIHDGVVVIFTTEAQEHPVRSKLAGRKVFQDVEVAYQRIPSAGSPKQENSDLITPDWLAMKDGEGRMDEPMTIFRDHYDKWKAGLESVQKGTPLADLADLTAAMVKTLEASKIETIEALVAVDERGLSSMLGPKARDIVAKAKTLLASVNPDMEAVQAENLRMSNDLEALKAQIAAMQEARAEPAPKKSAKPVKEDVAA